MYPAHRLDVSLRDLAFAARACRASHDRASLATRVEHAWSTEGLVCLSVRSAFDLFLTAHAWPRESEIVFSAVNVADMPRLARAHGILPVPADVDPIALVPTAESVERALSPRTRAIVVAQLFGAHADLRPIADVARRHGVLLIDDSAQAFRDPREAGREDTDASFYSFGTIKTATALGGALVRVRDAWVLARMRTIQSTWPVQAHDTYLQKVAKYAALIGASKPLAYELFAKACTLLRRDLDDVTRDALKGFPGASLIPQIRKQPSAALLALLERRLHRFDAGRLASRAAYGTRAARALPRGLVHAGGDLSSHTHWVFAARSASPSVVASRLRSGGFHATRRGASLEVIAAPEDRPELEPHEAHTLLRELVFLPTYPEMPERDFIRMLSTLPEV